MLKQMLKQMLKPFARALRVIKMSEAPFRISHLIGQKRDGKELSEDEINQFVRCVTSKPVLEGQIGAMLMAIYLNGMTHEETVHLTKAMMTSGESLMWPTEWKGSVGDKHSTGGVGDKVSLPLAPALAVCGVKVPMISGRSLGHTGGTLDKLESIRGFQVDIDSKRIREIVQNVGCCIVGQTDAMVPADKVLYSMRDVTATVSSVPLISSSIISKKACENPTALVLDVKCGKAAFATTEKSAHDLAQSLVGTCSGLGIKAVVLITAMDAPLGSAIGNSVEVAEAISCLNGEGPQDLKELVCEEGGHLLYTLKKAESVKDGAKRIAYALESGHALRKFGEMLEAQGVQPQDAQKLCHPGADPFKVLHLAKRKTELFAEKSGIVKEIDALALAIVTKELGAGRDEPEGSIDHGVGIVLCIRVGQFIEKSSKWVTVYHNGNLNDSLKTSMEKAIKIEQNAGTEDLPIFSRIIDVVYSKRKHPASIGQ
ncbi:thymidine phosphorylase-like [Acropora millepora]|uniref:thymidine phosphorylase-like n=1 Tax=Acropora millepora TaxID=45264 RepID=UPI001CF292F5|nr:thymidine phosphorylase-like [Acropora millepora]